MRTDRQNSTGNSREMAVALNRDEPCRVFALYLLALCMLNIDASVLRRRDPAGNHVLHESPALTNIVILDNARERKLAFVAGCPYYTTTMINDVCVCIYIYIYISPDG